MMKLIKYEFYKNKLFLLLATIITLVLGALPLPVAIKGSAGLAAIVPFLVIILLFYGISIGMLIFIVVQQREIWNSNSVLLYTLPVSRFKIFTSKIITGLLSTLVLITITTTYALIYIKILNGNEIINDILSQLPTSFTIGTILSSIGGWVYWVMTITFLIILSKTILGHNKNRGWIVALVAFALIIVLPITLSLSSLFVMGLDTAVNPQISNTMGLNVNLLIPDGTTLYLWVSIAFNWLMSIGMFISCGTLLKKRLNI